MIHRLTALALLLTAASCTNTGQSQPTHDVCTIAAPYAGPDLRGPVAKSAMQLRIADRSGLTAGERSALAAAFAKAKDATAAPSITAAVWQAGGAPGARAVLAYAPRQNAIVSVALTGEGSAEAIAHLLLKALEAAR